MANFAMRELSKYGWKKGKGLGKNENGITEPVKLATNQNKAGIGYNENNPWWNTLYDNTIKNIKVESCSDEVSLTTVNAVTPKSKRHYFCKAMDSSPNFVSREHCKLNFDIEEFGNDSQNLFKQFMQMKACYNKTVPEPTEHNFTSNGKLKRIAHHDALYLNTNPLLSDAWFDQKNVICKNTKSDIEKNEYETENASASQCLEDTKDFVFKTTKNKLHKIKLHKLIQQLNTCNLEENNNQKQKFLGKKLSQSMKKHKEEKNNLKKILPNVYNSMTNSSTSSSTSEVKITGGLFFRHAKLIQEKLLRGKVKRKSIDQTSDILSDMKLLELGRREKGKDSTEHKVDQSLKMENIVVDHKANKFKKDYIIIDVATETDKERENLDCKAIFESKEILSSRAILPSKVILPSKAILPSKVILSSKVVDSRKIFRRNISEVEAKNKYVNPVKDTFHFLKVYKKIQKKKNLNPHSKKIKKIVEKLNTEALANDLNSVIKNLTICSIAEKLKADTVKKKLITPTQTHFLPV